MRSRVHSTACAVVELRFVTGSFRSYNRACKLHLFFSFLAFTFIFYFPNAVHIAKQSYQDHKILKENTCISDLAMLSDQRSCTGKIVTDDK